MTVTVGAWVTFGVFVVVLCAGGGLLWEAGAVSFAAWRDPYLHSILRFTVIQAALSTVISVALAVPLARALARRVRARWVMQLGNLALIIPTMVAVFGIVAVHGRQGWVNDLLVTVAPNFYGARRDYLYGLPGILIAHVFFNLPLATRIFLNGLLTVPQHQWNIAALYGMRSWNVFRHIELPLLRGLMPGVAGMIFLLCFTSFAVVLTLGGGPKFTTLEVAIYQALRLDFDIARAVALSGVQVFVCTLVALMFFGGGLNALQLQAGDYATERARRPDAMTVLPTVTDTVVIFLAAVFLLSPLAAVFIRASSPTGWDIITHETFWRALGWTVAIAISAGALSCGLALAVANTIATARRSRTPSRALVPELVGLLTLIVPPITLGAGLFLFFRQFTDALSLGPALVIILNALLTLAFGIRILTPAVQLQRDRYDRLCGALGIRGVNYLRVLMRPLRRPITFALALAATLSAGDMGVIALFGTDQLHTLPLLIYRLIGNYRLPEAAVVAAILCALCFGMFWVLERIGR